MIFFNSLCLMMDVNFVGSKTFKQTRFNKGIKRNASAPILVPYFPKLAKNGQEGQMALLPLFEQP